MIIDTCLRTTILFYHQVYLVFPIVFSIFLTLFIFSTPVILPIFSTSFTLFILLTLLTLLILCFSTFGIKGCNIVVLMHLESWILGVRFNNVIEISLSKQSFSKKVDKPTLDLGALHDLLSINLSWFRKFGWFGDSIFELSIQSLRVFLYLFAIAVVSNYSSAPLTAYLNICFRRIIIIWFWCKRGVLAQILPR